MQKGNITHKESLPSQRLVKRRKLDLVDHTEKDEPLTNTNNNVPVKPKSRELKVEQIDEAASSSSDNDDNDDIEIERQRLQQLRESRLRQSSSAEDPASEKTADYDVLFRKPHRKSSTQTKIQNNKQESVAYKNFMKKMFK